MSELNMVKSIHADVLELRIQRQFDILCDWDSNKLTGRETIQKIIDEEKIIYFPSHPVFVEFIEKRNKKEGTK